MKKEYCDFCKEESFSLNYLNKMNDEIEAVCNDCYLWLKQEKRKEIICTHDWANIYSFIILIISIIGVLTGFWKELNLIFVGVIVSASYLIGMLVHDRNMEYLRVKEGVKNEDLE